MSTWHQRQRPAAIPPADQWTIISDPPNGLRTFMCFDTEAAARKCLQGLRANGHGEHLTLTPPRAGAKEMYS
jgi:hypothetical protein